MLKKMLLIMLVTLQAQASFVSERKGLSETQKQSNVRLEKKTASTSGFTKQVVRCKNGSKSFILIKNDIFYSDRYDKYLFAHDAAKDSCRKKRLRSKRNSIVCAHKKDMYTLLVDSIKTKKKLKSKGSCLTLKNSIPLKITNHFPLTSQITYYEIDYKGKKLYISSKSIYNSGKYRTKTKKTKTKRVQKNKSKKKNIVQKNKSKFKSKKKNKFKKKNKIENIKSKKKDLKRNKLKKSITKVAPDFNANDAISSSVASAPMPTTNPAIEQNSVDYDTDAPSLSRKKEQYFTYRCIGIYGDNRITVDNDLSMTHASNSVWRRCQALKKDDEVCKITDCYKLIK